MDAISLRRTKLLGVKGSMTVLLFAGIWMSPSVTAAEPAGESSVVSHQLKQEFRFSPVPTGDAADSSSLPVKDDALRLPKFEVRGSLRGVDQAIDDERRKREEEKFSWKRGGTILKHVGKTFTSELMFKFDPDTGITFVKISW